jgi:carboxypeptidase family protein
MKCLKPLSMTAFLLACASLAFGQAAVTSLRGTVTDPSGAVVAGAQVDLGDKSNGFHASRTTGADGSYEFPQLKPGSYTITATGAGFAKQSKAAELLVSQPATINFALSVSTSETTVEVSAEVQTLNTADATIGNAVGNSTIQALPMEGRNVPDLLSLQPGVVYLGRQANQDQDSRSGSVAGARSDQTNVTLDGIDNNDQRQGYAFTGALRSTLDSVEEFRVTTTNSNADSGRSSGAQVNLVTKSGSNSFHGSAYEYNRNTITAANDWFNKKAQLDSGLPNKAGRLDRNTYGASLGGPVKKDKLFFFLNYEAQKTSENQEEALIVPTDSFRQGIMKYRVADQSIVSLTPAQLASMDPDCSKAGTCPWGGGADPNVLAVLNKYPHANGTTKGDGLNAASFTWSAPNPTTLHTYIAKIDYALSSANHIFARGNLLGDRILEPPQFPGGTPSSTQVNTSKGLAVGDTWFVRNNLINNFRYGYVRQGLTNLGSGNASFVDFAEISPLIAETRTTLLNVPVHNFVDDLTWVKGKHTLQFGGNFRIIHNNTSSDTTSYNSGSMGAGLLSPASIANASNSQRTVNLDPVGYGFPAVDDRFATSYDNQVLTLAGIISGVTDNFNYKVSPGGASSSLLSTGTLIPRNFKNDEYEWYVQDSWRLKPNLTITFGVRHTLLQTPYEVNGQQVAPNINVHDWFESRGIAAAKGQVNQPSFSFVPTGQSRGGKPYWDMNKMNFAPRLSVAYSPNYNTGLLHSIFGGSGKTSIRAGAGMYYDHFGSGIVDSFSQFGSFGLTTGLSMPQNSYSIGNAPRYTGINDIPSYASTSITPPPATQQYPVIPPSNVFGSGFAISYGVDDKLKTPYSIAADFSIQRELPGGFTFEAAYVGRYGRRLLQQLDLASPTDFRDPVSGMDYYTASHILDAAFDAGATTVAPVAFWENVFPYAAQKQSGLSATQSIYNNLFLAEHGNDIANPFYLDVICSYPSGAPISPPCPRNLFWSNQYSSLYAWSTIGNSSYNAGQFMLRHGMSHGLQMDFGYTYSKSIDLGSDAERTSTFGTTSTTSSINQKTTFSQILDTWNPSKNRGPSDFDTRHMVTTDWFYQLPFGKGKAFATNSHGVTEALIGGWQFSGLARWTSGFPFSVQSALNGGWPTNWNWRSWMVQTAPIKTGLYHNAQGDPMVFPDPAALQAAIPSDTPWRTPYAGDAGSRNNFRGDGFFGIDAGLAKSWTIRENIALKFAWEIFNVTNSVRFDVNPNLSLGTLSSSQNLGVYSKTLTSPRVQQFSLRLSF